MRALRFAARSLTRTPLFTLTAVVILSLSVGAATAVFSLLYALILRPLPVPNADQLVRVTTFDRRSTSADLTWRMYRELAANQKIFATLIPSLDQSVMTFESERGVVRGAVAGAAGNLFADLGATPTLGRLIQPADVDFAVPAGEPVAVVSWTFWQRHYLGDPNVVGQRITVEGVPLTIVGVGPRNFLGFSVTIDHDLWVPIGLLPKLMDSEVSMVQGTSRWVSTFGKLAPGVTMSEAQAQLKTMWPALLEAAQPDQYRNIQKEEFLRIGVNLASGATGVERGLRSRYTQPLYALLGIAGLVLLITAANLASLVFARAEARGHELAVRLALGAERWRVVRECAAEGLLIGAVSSAGGVLLASVSSQAIVTFLMRDYTVPVAFDVTPGAVVIGAAVTASFALALMATVAAALNGTRRAALVPGGGRTIARSSRTGKILVGAQIAVSIVMLAHASLLVRSVLAIAAVDTGLTKETVVISYTQPIDAYRGVNIETYYPQALDKVRLVPGVTSAAFSTFKPDGGGLPSEPVGRGSTPRESGDRQALWTQVSPEFFETMGLTMLRGRDFTFADNVQSRKVIVISETLERQLFGEGQGLGQRMRISARPEWQDADVIGVVNDARTFDVRNDDLAIAYTAAIQSGPGSLYRCLVARAPESAAPGIRQAIESLGVELMQRSQTLAYARSRAILQERLMASLGGAFAVLALMLVAAGIYGLLSYIFSLRRKEIGIRMALGADARQMARGILTDGLMLTAIGIIVGLAGALASVPLLRSVLVHVTPYDPLAIGAACAVLVVVTMMASLLPARRAARVEPLTELRQD